MPFAYADCRSHVRTLVQDVAADPRFETEISLHYNNRLFFVRNMSTINGRGNTLKEKIATHNIIPANERPALGDWQAIGGLRPMTLHAAMRIRNAFEVIANNGNNTVLTYITDRGVPIQIQPNDIVPSVYFANSEQLRRARDSIGLTRQQLSIAAVDNPDAVKFLEDGDGKLRFRITKATAQLIYDALKAKQTELNYSQITIAPFSALFTYHQAPSPKCFALPREYGNVIE